MAGGFLWNVDGGSDWQTVRNDGTTTLDVRLVLKTTDGDLICMRYQGVRHGPPEIVQSIEEVRPSIQRVITSAPMPYSTQRLPNSIGLIISLPLGSAIA